MDWYGQKIVRWRVGALKEQRKKCNLTLREFAVKADWAPSYQSHLENRAKSISTERKEWITEVFEQMFGKEVGDVFSRQVIRWPVDGPRVKIARETCGISQRRFAKLMKWNNNSQRALESGKMLTINDRRKLRIEGILNGTITHVVKESQPKVHLGRDIAFWRNYCGLTQKEFAAQAGWDEGFQRYLETGATFLYETKDRLIAVFQTLGCTWDNLKEYKVPISWKIRGRVISKKEKGKVVASKRRACGFTMAQFANELGWDETRLHDIESGCGKKVTKNEEECINNLLQEKENVARCE